MIIQFTDLLWDARRTAEWLSIPGDTGKLQERSPGEERKPPLLLVHIVHNLPHHLLGPCCPTFRICHNPDIILLHIKVPDPLLNIQVGPRHDHRAMRIPDIIIQRRSFEKFLEQLIFLL